MARIEFLDAEYLEHGGVTKADRGKFTSIWNSITDYWNMVKGLEHVDMAWKAGQRMVDAANSHADSLDGAWAIEKGSLTSRTAGLVPIQFLFGTEDYFTNCDGGSTRSEFLDEIPDGAILCIPTGVADEYVLPTWLRYPSAFADFIAYPNMTLGSSDYAVDTSVVDNRNGTITFSSDYKDIMWCLYSLTKSITNIIMPYGKMVDYTCRKEGRFETDAFYDAQALRYALMNGPTNYNIELGISVFNLWPYSPFKGQVTSITGTTEIQLRNMDDEYETAIIANSNGLPFKQRTEDGWVDIALMDIIEPYRSLTKACRIETWNSDSDLLEGYGFTRPSGRHALAVLFDASLPLIGAMDGWLPDPTLPSLTIPALDGYAIDQARTSLHFNRAKNSGTSPFYVVILDAEINILDIDTSYGSWIEAPEGEIETSLKALITPSMYIETTFWRWPGILLSSIDTAYSSVNIPMNGQIETAHSILSQAPIASLSGTSY